MVNEVAAHLWQYEDNLSSFPQAWISVVDSLKNQKICSKSYLKNWIGPTSHLYRPVPQLLGEIMPLLKRDCMQHEAPCGFTCVTMERT